MLLPRVNLFIADDTGLGKTIEAGLIARELLLRKKVRDIVVACPPSMLHQWQDELEIRFGLAFEILERDYIAGVRRERGWTVNPWDTHTRFLVSHRLLIDETYAGPLRDWLGDFRPGSLLILDEAHHAAPSSGSKYAIDTKITQAVRSLARHFEHRLFLSATPHNGHSNSFSALLELLDPQRFCRGVRVRGRKLLDDVMVRRLKEDVREVVGGFPRRKVCQIDLRDLPADAPELKLSVLLDRYRRQREERLAGETKRRRAAAGLLVIGLQQRLLSSIEAFASTLRVHRRTVLRQWKKALAGARQLEIPPASRRDLLGGGVGSDDDRATLAEDELRAEEEAQFEAASAATVGPTAGDAAALFAAEQRLLDEMEKVAEASRGLPDARVRHLVDWIREHMCPNLPPLGESADPDDRPEWNDVRVILFTEYDATKRYLFEQLSAAIAGTDRAARRIEIFHGPTPQDRRREIKRAFNADPAKHPVRILIATDAAREGLNLQAHCYHLFHFDVPWNPGRMEQRNGRIDRKLQPEDEVFCHYFYYHQRPEDRVLRKLVEKTKTIREELGSLSPVIEGRLAKLMAGGIGHDRVEELERQIDEAELEEAKRRALAEELDEARARQEELEAQIDILRDRVEEAKKWLGFDEAHFRATLSSSLELLGAEPLAPLGPDPERDRPVERYAFPALDRREGADPTWADTLDALRAPRRPDQKLWQWRAESPIRPVVFEDPGTVQEDVVHLHLEHRVVQRLLGRFRAQGFVHNDLSRACLVETSDAIPRVIVLGRLSLFGPGAARLHDQLISVAARWVDPKRRPQPLAPYAREAESKTLDLLEEALLAARGRRVSDVVRRRIEAAARRDVAELRPHLEDRGLELAAEAEKRLEERGVREAHSMRQILSAQRHRVKTTFERYQNYDPRLLPREEGRQLAADRRHWVKRLESLERELESEPARIRDVYRIQAMRVEPVGLAYLWPETG